MSLPSYTITTSALMYIHEMKSWIEQILHETRKEPDPAPGRAAMERIKAAINASHPDFARGCIPSKCAPIEVAYDDVRALRFILTALYTERELLDETFAKYYMNPQNYEEWLEEEIARTEKFESVSVIEHLSKLA